MSEQVFDIQLFSGPLTQADMQRCAGQLLDRIGETDVFDMYVRLKFMADTLAAVLKDPRMQDAVIAEREKYGRTEKVTASGAEIVTASRTVRDFATCQDAVWNRLTEQYKTIGANIKEREKMLGAVKEQMCVVDELTGEAVYIYPAVKQVTEYVKVTFPKA